MRCLLRISLTILIGCSLFLNLPSLVHSKPEYAEQTGSDCTVCHLEATGKPGT